MRPLYRDAWITFGLIALTVGLYFCSIHGSFIYDDLEQILTNPAIHGFGGVFRMVESGLRQSRFVMNLSFAFNWWLSGADTWSYHVLNVVMHLGNALLLRRFLSRILPENHFVVISTVALFLLHPLQAQSVAYVMGRISLLECMTFLLALNLVIERGTRRNHWLLGMLLFLSPLVKETSVLLPGVLFLYWLTIGSENLRDLDLKGRWTYFIPWLSGVAWFRWSHVDNYSGIVGFQLFPPGEYFLTQMYYVLFRLKLLFYPAGQSLLHEYPSFSPGIFIFGVLGFALLSGIAIVGWRVRKSSRVLAFFLGFFLLTLAPIGTVLQFVNPFAEYRLYLSNISIFFMMALALDRIIGRSQKKILPVFLLGGLLIVFSFSTWQENLLWADPLLLVESSLDQYPQSDLLYSTLGWQLAARGRYGEAEKAYLESDRLNTLYGRNKTARQKILLVVLYEEQGLWVKARAAIEALPVSLLSLGPPQAYFQHYLKILKALHDESRFQVVYQDGLKWYSSSVLLAMVSQ